MLARCATIVILNLNAMTSAMLICPICRTTLVLQNKTYVCQNHHSYDVAKDGYVNLHVVQHKNSHNAGDTTLSVQARRRFLVGGFYAPAKSAIIQIIKTLEAQKVLDIGCGEGYYTCGLGEVVNEVIGVDIAKSAIQAASKAYKGQADKKNNITWVVGTGAVLPVADGSIDVCTSFFSPLPKQEMLRVLKPRGHLLIATPAPHHLYALRDRLFDTVNLHNPTKFIHELSPEFTLLNEWQIDTPMQLGSQSLSDLMDMTPYAYKAKLDKKATLKAEQDFNVVASFCLYLFHKD